MKPQEMQELAALLQQLPGIKSIELRDVKKLAELLRQSPEIGSIDVKGWFGSQVVITRTNATGHAGAPPPPVAVAPQAAPPPPAFAPVPAPAAEASAPPAPAPAPASALKEIKSPMVGTFYRAPEPGAEPYVQVGSRIGSGQTVCIVEAMKIMNEIEAEVTGVVKEVCVEDSQPVEYGQVLFRVDPNG